jgi:O-antigen biosynthesis protein WbqV
MRPTPPGDLFAGANLRTLLGRPLRDIPVADGLSQLGGACVLVTGAGGSVGSSLIARLAQHRPGRVVALDSHEASLFRLGRDAPAELPIELELADVRNAAKLSRLFRAIRPDVVIHLAAYKHVPIGERAPDEPVSVNVIGTDVVAQVAVDAGVRHLVYTSSDKAVNPPSVYGATKRLAEALLHAQARAQLTTAIHVLRYVNIIGTSGSVIETFASQVRGGASLTITDGRMTRYWMAMDEAVALTWHALALPTGSHTMLDVGDPHLVRALGERVASVVRPDGPSPTFVETGARPGERLAEELTSSNERLVRCGAAPVWNIVRERQAAPPDLVADMLVEINDLLAGDDLGALRDRVMAYSQALQ